MAVTKQAFLLLYGAIFLGWPFFWPTSGTRCASAKCKVSIQFLEYVDKNPKCSSKAIPEIRSAGDKNRRARVAPRPP